MAALDVFEQISTSFATVSLNNQGVDVPHLDIETKLRAISEAGMFLSSAGDVKNAFRLPRPFYS